MSNQLGSAISIADTRAKNHQIELEKCFSDSTFFYPISLETAFFYPILLETDEIVITLSNIATQKGMYSEKLNLTKDSVRTTNL